ncbi:MAG: TIGR03960 family B12-binding radical SAM protein [Proteobacteria bacterium]|nr:TIGR03960 family B12-binding radical SAM protein [Pseudomonadota bacterium]
MIKEDLLHVSKPSRYIGGEINSVVKDLDSTRLKFALAFPDVYEVGMSHLGFQILYHILNHDPEIACERVFAPWPDMEKLLRDKGLPLTTLESSIPLKEFDVIGFSLQYELNYTGVLNILDLSGIPLRSNERGEREPLIIGGGPCALNPEPLAEFFDAFVLGDGEEVVLEIGRAIIASREKDESRTSLLTRLSRIEGVYIPSFFRVDYHSDGRVERIIPLDENYPTVSRRILPDLNEGDFPRHPILPFTEIIHDRLNIEIARGCTRGCRFCQAGMIYRPVRERSPQKIWQLIEEGLKNTGHDEVSLLSLSTGDYSCLEPLLTNFIDQYRSERVAVSLPSLRVETLKPSLIQKIREVRKTGFTLAPEAGTTRLRQVINKGNTEEDLLASIHAVFSANWQLVKLYFMIGLPTETEEDLNGIIALCRRALAEARRVKGSARINISMSTFIPKAHTPFQWESQLSMPEIARKQKFLRRNLERYGFSLKWVDPSLSLLEGVFARGDRRLGHTLELAYQLGCRLDGWGDHFCWERWEKAFAQTNLDPPFYTQRLRELDEILPWDHLDSRVSKRFLQEERYKAFQGVATVDCREASCTGCGVCYGVELFRNRLADKNENRSQESSRAQKTKMPPPPIHRLRSHYAKFGAMKFLGHLDLTRSLTRAFRRARIPLSFSQGFHPLPRISFGPPLPLGYVSWAEFLDFSIQGNIHPQEITLRLNKVLPVGIKFLETKEILLKSPSIFDSIIHNLYLIRFSDAGELQEEKIEIFQRDEKIVFWEGPKNKSFDLKKLVESIDWVDKVTLQMRIRSGEGGTIRPEKILDFIFGWPKEKRPAMTIQKLQAEFRESDPWLTKS